MTVLPDDGLSLAAEFPDATHEQWQRLVEGVLRKSGKEVSGDAAEDALSTKLEDGLTTRPLYTSADAEPGLPGFAPYLRGARPEGNAAGGWDVRQRHSHPDPVRANEALLGDLENGVTSLWLTVGEGGLPVEGLARALDGVYLDLAPIALDSGAQFAGAAAELVRLHTERGTPADDVRGNLGGDPLGYEARTGRAQDFAPVAEYAAQGQFPHLRALTVDALPYHEAGASAGQELGASMATAVAYLRELTEAGLTAEQAVGQLEFRYAASADQFLTIAKFRAARRLWARVAEVCGTEGAQRQHAVTSSVMMSRRDPWVNMLRTTVATLAAGVGGAESVTVLPFDHALGLPDAFARRIARNTSTILLEESHLARVIDPAGGSWYVEQLTGQLARAGWEFFQEIERAGGQAAALRSGMLRERIAETWSVRSKKLATRKEPITGVSEFPHLAEKPVEREAAPAAPAGGLPRVSRDEAYEDLRARSDAYLRVKGERPKVFLATLGPAAAHTARATFAANLFQAGGIEPVTGEFASSGARIVCLCSSDGVYEEQAAATAAELRASGAEYVFLAGKPASYEGVDSYVFAGCNAVDVLTSTLDRLGVS
ncbi:methylmalonyl-CoA mutase [Streptomyces sp. YC504]|uniref:methylmalonyl-CoA mutase n=1 Tax=Streptomyces mesophilus TaxID=1775132 RepID=A0A6G4XUR3_9ACTN|nr:methylmalonyl-CoA mutase family protein [Streptomyces mesophilus]NGO80434.1 methylmalonyl-CoA mutase [Streptomyces mesophilus]